MYLGIEFPDGEEIYFSQGVFVLDEPSIESTPSKKQITISGQDKYILLSDLGTKLTKILYFPKNTLAVSYIIREILLLSGDQTPAIIDSYFDNILLPYDLVIDIGQTYADAFTKLSRSFSCNIFYDTDGRLNVTQSLLSLQDSLRGSSWDFLIDEQEYLNSKASFNFRDVYNQVMVLGQNISGNAVSYIAQNTNLQSNTNIYKIPIRTNIIKDEMISTTDLARIRAEYELRSATMMGVSVSVSSVPLYHLKEEDIATLSDEKQGFEIARLFIQTISMPVSTKSAMNITFINTNELT